MLVEPIIGNGIDAPQDYRFFVFGGEVQFVAIEQSPVDHRRVFYSRSWGRLPIRDGYPVGIDAKLPQCFDEMVAVAEVLGRDLGFVRVDLYEVEGQVYFGEMTMVPSAGHMRFEPPELDAELGTKWR